jgi:hypothetical protein
MGAMNSGFEIDDQNRAGEISGDDGDSRSAAVRRASAGAEAWRAALDAQRSAVPDHADFYGLTREWVFTFGPLGELMHVISGQVAGYADSLPSGEQVYEDERRDDPRVLLAEAAQLLDGLAFQVTGIALEINRFWSLIGRIGVEQTRPEPGRDDIAEETS